MTSRPAQETSQSYAHIALNLTERTSATRHFHFQPTPLHQRGENVNTVPTLRIFVPI